MKTFLPIVSWLALVLVIGAPLLYLAGNLQKPAMTTLMLVGTIVWFATVPFWMGRGSARDGSQ